jgi:hypothetical protein
LYVLKEIFIPIDINYKTAIKFSRELKKVKLDEYKEKDFTIDLRNFAKSNGRIEPYGSLLVINSIRTFAEMAKKKGITIKVRYVKNEMKIKNTYAKALRFYSSLGLPIGCNPEEDYYGTNGSRFIPIMKVDVSAVKSSVDEYRDIKYISSHISKVASRGNEILYDCVDFCVTEIIRNIIEHSDSKNIWYAAQYWPSKQGGEMVEISIMDEGVGIKKSLEMKFNDEQDLLKLSLVPGCSRNQTIHYVESSDNAGFGLYMISEIGKRNGDFIISSSNESLYLFDEDEERHNCLMKGTIIRLRLSLNSLKNYKTQKGQLIDNGLTIVKRFNKYQETKKFAPGLPISDFIKN